MRIRKKQHPVLHGAAFILTGGASAPVSAAMMGSKAVSNSRADAEVRLLAGGGGSSAQATGRPARYGRDRVSKSADFPWTPEKLEAMFARPEEEDPAPPQP